MGEKIKSIIKRRNEESLLEEKQICALIFEYSVYEVHPVERIDEEICQKLCLLRYSRWISDVPRTISLDVLSFILHPVK